MARGRRALWRGVREEPALLRPSTLTPTETWWIWVGRDASDPGVDAPASGLDQQAPRLGLRERGQGWPGRRSEDSPDLDTDQTGAVERTAQPSAEQSEDLLS